MSEVRTQLAEYASTNDKRHQLNDEEIKTGILENLCETSQKRLQEVIYNVFLYDSSKVEIDFAIFEIKESDLLLGTK
ncbi:hypothetical protein [Chryseobacterium hagamense]|uniref:Uncharacterized protein n=1 Tax=Chryseobacterium hagamense TaxID=395935 RepID=A0A511YSU8_9FLAO|nr:hypothetical protein [Chryseobacterium hagamense]GEN78246.1 hypothetical protein CHA01nite_39860 [Chryseobacterium hagamense]